MRRANFLVLLVLAGGSMTATAQLSTCPYVVADHPFSATWTLVQSGGSMAEKSWKATMPVARNTAGSIRCGAPQPGREPNPTEILNAELGLDIFFPASTGRVDVHRNHTGGAGRFTEASAERTIARMASTTPSTRQEGDLTIEKRVVGQRLVNGILCIGFLEVTRGTETEVVHGKDIPDQRVDRETEEWISPLYGRLESSSYDRLHDTHSHFTLEDFRTGEPDPALLRVPPEYAEAYAEAVATLSGPAAAAAAASR